MAHSTTFLSTKADMDWLFEVHLKHRTDRKKWHSAILTGNEDCPCEVDLYARKDPMLNDPVRKVIENYEPCDKDVTFQGRAVNKTK